MLKLYHIYLDLGRANRETFSLQNARSPMRRQPCSALGVGCGRVKGHRDHLTPSRHGQMCGYVQFIGPVAIPTGYKRRLDTTVLGTMGVQDLAGPSSLS
jgi:hypothetical protein